MGDKRSTLSATVFEQHCRRGYTLLFRAGTVLLFVMYSWRWDIHHSCCVGQTWLSNSSRVKSSWSTIPFFPLTCFLPEARKPKTSAHLVPLGNIGIFNNMLWKKKKKTPPSILWQSSNLIQNPAQHPQPPPSCAYRNPHTNDSVPHTHSDMRAHSRALTVHTQPGAPIFLWASLLWPQSPFHISEDVYAVCACVCVV